MCMENYNYIYRISIKILVEDQNWNILLAKESNWTFSLLWWWIEYSETPQETIKREVFEECWLNVENIDKTPFYFFTFSKENKDIHFAHIIYKAKISSIENFTKSKECIWLQYYSIDEIKKLKLWQWLKALFKNYNILWN